MNWPHPTAAVKSKMHLVLAVLWGTLGTLVTVVWLANSILWVAFISVYAIVVSHLDGYAAHRAEGETQDS